MKTRITGPANSFYHVFSRIIERRFYLGNKEKEVFRSLMWKAAEFSGVKIVTYCILDNHFHILVQIPERRTVDDEELLRRLKILYRTDRQRKGPYDPVQEFINSESDPFLRKKLRSKYLRRMYNLSEFMRTLKLRFSFWYNRNHDREGTLWDARFQSILVEGNSPNNHKSSSNLALITVAAYIDLNCVRAGITDDPKNYQWCGYAEAFAGSQIMREGLCFLYGNHFIDNSPDWKSVAITYRSVLCKSDNKEMSESTSLADSLRCRIRYFTRGAVLGSREFVENAFENHRWKFSANRKTGARKLRGKNWGELYAARQVSSTMSLSSTHF